MTNIFFKVPNIESNQRRKCHRAKPVFLEESEAFKEQKHIKDRERRKKRKLMFENKSPLGTRRVSQGKIPFQILGRNSFICYSSSLIKVIIVSGIYIVSSELFGGKLWQSKPRGSNFREKVQHVLNSNCIQI